ncbi:MAG: TonB-dependent receptor [Ignavibacteriales bacterium]|nr:TonB-dependent receptor [Ignavibacteriales bacterium]
MRLLLSLFFVLILLSYGVIAQSTGTITGKVLDEKTGDVLPFVNVQLKGTLLGASSDEKGVFTISGVPEGTYTLMATLIGHSAKDIPGLNIKAGETLTQNISMTDAAVQMREVVVFGPSMKQERMTEAPSAISVLDEGQIKLVGGSGQPAKLLETQPGVDIAQSGLNDFNVNTRGFNSSLNRRLLVLLDGRDLAIAFLGAQEWNGLSVPVEDLGRLELVRGPSSALYGANAFNGVINIQTPRPKEIVGTKATLALGEMSSVRADVRYAAVRGQLSYKANFGHFQGNTWSVTRKNLNFEYPGFNLLQNEEVDLLSNHVASTYGSMRVDYDFENGDIATFEGGLTQVENEVFITGIGRVQVPKALKPWGRMSYSNTNWYAQVWGAGRESSTPQLSLSSGLPLNEHSFITQGEFQYRNTLFDPKLFFIGGLTFRYQTINTNKTLMQESRVDNSSGLYGQFEYTYSPQLKIVGAARWDRSTLHESQISPKIAVVWSFNASHSLRATYNQAFQAPNLSELFLYVLRTPTDLSNNKKMYSLSSAYLGNKNLQVEKITGYEIGYKGIIDNKFFVTVDGYLNFLKDFITDLGAGQHPDYPATDNGYKYVLPGDTTKDDDGLPVGRSVWSYSNAGKVTETGIEIGLNYYLSDNWILDANYAFFDFSILEKGKNDILLPNAPKHKVNGGITFQSEKGLDVNLSLKYVPSFDWAAGIYTGRIYEYTLLNLAVNYKLTPNYIVGLNISNLLDREHYQIFGGSFIKRRSVLTMTAMF